MKVDHAKQTQEKLLEQAVAILSHTIPEQKVDAIGEYHRVIQILKKGNDWKIQPILTQLQMLYMYPGRNLHNEMLSDLHDLLEEVREDRINKVIEKQQSLNGYGDGVSTKGSSKILLMIIATVALALLWVRS